jgi:hypothetical protein
MLIFALSAAHRGAVIGSDHDLVTADRNPDRKLTLIKTVPKYSRKRSNTGKLSNIKTKQDFRLEVKNRFHTLQGSDIERKKKQIEENW